jgi:hypothetical protein
MNEKPGLEPGFFCSTNCWRPDGYALLPVPSTCFPRILPLGGYSMKATIVQCNCGAEYRRTEEKFLVPHTGDAVCTVCGAALESWSESTHVPIYELIERPDKKLK